MIRGIGVDIIEISRLAGAFERHGAAFKRRVYTLAEQAEGESRGRQSLGYFAGRWAAKEAVAKALGTGFGEHCRWLDISITNDASGCPVVALSGAGAATAMARGISRIHLSISHEQSLAVAYVIAESENS